MNGLILENQIAIMRAIAELNPGIEDDMLDRIAVTTAALAILDSDKDAHRWLRAAYSLPGMPGRSLLPKV